MEGSRKAGDGCWRGGGGGRGDEVEVGGEVDVEGWVARQLLLIDQERQAEIDEAHEATSSLTPKVITIKQIMYNMT
jgi:hypothetical protein